MNALKDVASRIALRLHSQSDAVLGQVKNASRCVQHLHAHGCAVQQVLVRPGYVVIEIDKPSDWLSGAVKTSTPSAHDEREVVYVARVLGCTVQWTERVAAARLRREG